VRRSRALRDGKAGTRLRCRAIHCPTYVRQVPGRHMVEGPVPAGAHRDLRSPKTNPRRFSAVTEFMTEAKRNGTVRKALDARGYGVPVAPLTHSSQSNSRNGKSGRCLTSAAHPHRRRHQRPGCAAAGMVARCCLVSLLLAALVLLLSIDSATR